MNTREHFDEIAACYDSEIPEHVRLNLLACKTEAMQSVLASRLPSDARGLDCGCGTGHYVREMARRGYRMTGLEYSEGMRHQAAIANHQIGAEIHSGSITQIPFPDASFDFCFTINVLHHLPDTAAQTAALREMLRVLRPCGLAFIHGFDADNPLVRFYMKAIFPLTSWIDDDQAEIWVSPAALERQGIPGGSFVSTVKFTMLPNFAPRFLFLMLRSLERASERISGNRFGAHFMTTFVRAA